MDKFAVTVMPITDVDSWRQFLEEASTGPRAQAHRDFLRRGGITAEHVIHEPTPMGDLMVLVWEGVDQSGAAEQMRRLVQNPSSDHERYLRDHVIPEFHGVDVTQPPPPPAELVESIRV